MSLIPTCVGLVCRSGSFFCVCTLALDCIHGVVLLAYNMGLHRVCGSSRLCRCSFGGGACLWGRTWVDLAGVCGVRCACRLAGCARSCTLLDCSVWQACESLLRCSAGMECVCAYVCVLCMLECAACAPALPSGCMGNSRCYVARCVSRIASTTKLLLCVRVPALLCVTVSTRRDCVETVFVARLSTRLVPACVGAPTLVNFACLSSRSLWVYHARSGKIVCPFGRVLSCPCIHSFQPAPESVFSTACVSLRVRRGVLLPSGTLLTLPCCIIGLHACSPGLCAAVWPYCWQLLVARNQKGRDGVAVCVWTHLAVSSAHPRRADVASMTLRLLDLFSKLGLLPLQRGGLYQGVRRGMLVWHARRVPVRVTIVHDGLGHPVPLPCFGSSVMVADSHLNQLLQ